MEKIINYIRNGKGFGVVFILAASVLLTLIFMIFIKAGYNDARPQIITVAQDFLPVTVENGVVVNPNDTYKRVNIDFSENRDGKDMFSVVLNTRDGVSVTTQDDKGLYLLKKQFCLVSEQKVQCQDLKDALWDKAYFEKFLDSSVSSVFALISVALIVLQFAFYLVLAYFSAILGLLVLKYVSKKEFVSMPVLMRLSAVLVAVLEVLRWVLIFVGITPSNFIIVLLVVLAEISFVNKFQNEE